MQLLALLVLVLAVQLRLPAGAAAGGWNDCTAPMPKCKSDRFDIVYSHKRNGWGCKVYECKCKKPQSEQCSSGKARLRTDQHGCRYYECVVCPARQTCPGSKVSKYKGDDADGCPLYHCQCDRHPSRPACAANEQIRSGTDGSGCTYFFCQQVRASCPEKPSCSSNQELVAGGRVGDCRIYKCECLTPSRPACAIGSQPRLQDDGLGCQTYRCVENRTPCPSQPTCSSPYHIVAQDGVDDSNCVKFVCQCMPLTDVNCPSGYARQLDTDPATGCQFHRCQPQCQPQPNCTSVYKRPVVTASRSNGCPKFSCRCVQPEVVDCLEDGAHLQLTKASDGSNCDVYECRSAQEDSSCAVPTCRRPLPTGDIDASGCPVYACSDCPPPPDCDGAGRLLIRAGQDSAGCLQYLCYRTVCPKPTACSRTQLAVVTSYRGTCPLYSCWRNSECAPVPACPDGMAAQQIGHLSNKCPQYICQPSTCPAPAVCSIGQQASWTVDSGACVGVTCGSSGSRSCEDPPDCGRDNSVAALGVNSAGCTRYGCQPAGCPAPGVSCSANQEPVVAEHTAAGCPVYSCQRVPSGCQPAPSCQQEFRLNSTASSGGCPQFRCCRRPPACQQGRSLLAVGTDAGGCAVYECREQRACSVPACGAGTTLTVIGTDAGGCTRYSCCASKPDCPPPQVLTVTGTDANGCNLYQCRSERVCTVPACGSGRELTWTGQFESGCKKYFCCAAKPSCRQGETVAVTGTDGNGCSLYQCKADRTCTVPTCSTDQVLTEVGADSGTGCTRYTCCGVPPSCTADRTLIVTGTDSAGCNLYQCRSDRACTVPTCTEGHVLTEVGTDSGSGCKKYTCCSVPPSCTAGQTLTVTGTDGGGCNLYQCKADRTCTVPTCSSGQTLTRTGTDSDGCESYVCCTSKPACGQGETLSITGTSSRGCSLYQCKSDRTCTVPTCSSDRSLTIVGTDGSTGCTEFACCDLPLHCSTGQTLVITGTDGSGCNLYQCKADRTCTVPTCSSGQTLTGTGTGADGCEKYVCCDAKPTCSQGQSLLVTGTDARGCRLYQCKSDRTCTVPTCSAGNLLTVVGTDASSGCTKFTCCLAPPACSSGQTLSITGADGSGCNLYQCKSDRACTVPTCTSGQTLTGTGTDSNGCKKYICCTSKPTCGQGESATVTGADSNGCSLYQCRSDRSCTQPQRCPDGQLPKAIGTDSSGCAVYSDCSSPCPKQPQCKYRQFRVRHKEQRAGHECDVFSCINLGDYRGKPEKCSDNPAFCEISQTIETFVDHRRRCQKVECKDSNDDDMMQYLAAMGF